MGDRFYHLTGDGAAEIEAAAREIATMAVEEFARYLDQQIGERVVEPWAADMRTAIRAASASFGAERDGEPRGYVTEKRTPPFVACGTAHPNGSMCDERRGHDGFHHASRNGWDAFMWEQEGDVRIATPTVFALSDCDGCRRELCAGHRLIRYGDDGRGQYDPPPDALKSPAKGGPPCTDPCSAQPGASPGETGRGDSLAYLRERADAHRLAARLVSETSDCHGYHSKHAERMQAAANELGQARRRIADLEADNAALSRRVEGIERSARAVVDEMDVLNGVSRFSVERLAETLGEK